MQPTPPMALKPSAMSSLPESWQKSSPQASRWAVTRARLPVASLTPTIVREFRDLGQGFDRYVGDGPRRYVVDDDRKRRCLGNRAEMGGDARPGSAGCNKARRPARRRRRLRLRLRSARWHAAVELLPQPAITGTRPFADLDGGRNHLAMLVARKRRALAGRAARDQRRCCLRRSASRRTREVCLHRHSCPKKVSPVPVSTRKT